MIDSKQKGNGKHINHRKPRTIKGRKKHNGKERNGKNVRSTPLQG